MIWALVACAAVLMVPQCLLIHRLMVANKELSKLLASRNFSEFTVGEARIAKATAERKPKEDSGYESAWDSEDK